MPEPKGPVRADAQRNRDRILEVALAELSRAPDVPLSAIAKRSGVGQGTLYRHFPDREALILEVYRRETQQVADIAAVLLENRPPRQALREWMGHLARYAIAKAGLADALRQVTTAPSSPGTPEYAAMTAAAEMLLRAAEEAGTIRPGVTVEDFFLAVAGLWQLDSCADWQPRLDRLLDLVMDGLCAGAPRPG